MKINRQIYAVFLLFTSSFCAANNQALELNTQISDFLDNYAEKLAANGYRSEYKIGRIDPRLSVKNCNQNLNLAFNREPIKQNRVTIEVECLDATPWKLFVNINFNIYGLAVIASEIIPRGTRITTAMLAMKEEIMNQGRYNSYSSTDDIVGMLAKRSIRSGAAITPGFLIAPNMVNRGDKVVIIATNSAISVKMNGTALASGTLGEQISIRNNQSKRVVKAKVIDDGRVLVAL